MDVPTTAPVESVESSREEVELPPVCGEEVAEEAIMTMMIAATLRTPLLTPTMAMVIIRMAVVDQADP